MLVERGIGIWDWDGVLGNPLFRLLVALLPVGGLRLRKFPSEVVFEILEGCFNSIQFCDGEGVIEGLPTIRVSPRYEFHLLGMRIDPADARFTGVGTEAFSADDCFKDDAEFSVGGNIDVGLDLFLAMFSQTGMGEGGWGDWSHGFFAAWGTGDRVATGDELIVAPESREATDSHYKGLRARWQFDIGCEAKKYGVGPSRPYSPFVVALRKSV